MYVKQLEKTATVNVNMNEREVNLYYYLLKNIERDVPTYGIEVVKDSVLTKEYECGYSLDVFDDFEEAKGFVEKLARNLVTPLGFSDIAKDYISCIG